MPRCVLSIPTDEVTVIREGERTILLVIHVLRPPPRLMLCPLTVDIVRALGLAELVDFTSSNARNELLGESVIDLLACGGPSVCTGHKVPLAIADQLYSPSLRC